MNTIKKCPLLLSLLVLSASISPTLVKAGHDGVDDVLTGVAITGAVAAGVIGITALGKRMFGPSSETMLNEAEDDYRAAYDKYSRLIGVVEQANSAPITSLSYQEKQDILQSPCEHLLSDIASCVVIDAQAYCSQMNATLNQLKRQYKKVTKFMKKRSAAKYVDLPDFADDLEQFIEKLAFMERVVTRHAHYFALANTQYSLLQKYGADLVIAQKHKDDACGFADRLRSSIMEHGRLVKSSFPYLAYVDRLSHDKRALEGKLSRISASTYPDKYAESRALYASLDAIAREVMAEDDYAQSLRDREQLRHQQSVEREQARLANENRRLRSELVREQRRPRHVVVEHEYIDPWWSPVYTVDYVVPVVQPAVSFEYAYDDYYDDTDVSFSMGFNL